MLRRCPEVRQIRFNVCDGVPDLCDVLQECVAHLKTCDGAEIFLSRPIITRALNDALVPPCTTRVQYHHRRKAGYRTISAY